MRPFDRFFKPCATCSWICSSIIFLSGQQPPFSSSIVHTFHISSLKGSSSRFSSTWLRSSSIMDNNGHDQAFSELLSSQKKEKRKEQRDDGQSSENAMGISMTITVQVCLSSFVVIFFRFTWPAGGCLQNRRRQTWQGASWMEFHCVLWLTLTGLQPWWSIRHLLSAFLHW